MKKSILVLYALFCTILITAQHFGLENNNTTKLENKVVNGQHRKSANDISGICDAFTRNMDPVPIDICEGTFFEGIIEFESVDGELYNVYSTNENGTRLNDCSFGGYYACYGTETQEGMSNASTESPTLFFKVDAEGELSYQGASQWGETFFVTDVKMSGAVLEFTWYNIYGEQASVKLTRHDGQIWQVLLTSCTATKADSLALVALYNATDGPNWNIPWDLSTPVSSWYGVTYDRQSCRVSELHLGTTIELGSQGLDANNLTGTIPPEIGNLSSLTSLILNGNKLSGTIPSDIGNLSNLTNLNLTANELVGSVPDEISNLTKLEILELSANQLDGEILSKLTDLVELQKLALSSNSFTGTIPSEISNLDKLEQCFLFGNSFHGNLPIELSTLPRLQSFYAQINDLSGTIPIEFGQFKHLRYLNLSGNNLSGNIPEALGNISTLYELTLGYNSLSGGIPDSLGQLPKLSYLGLSYNQLSGTIPEGFDGLEYLRLNSNNFSGEFPESFASENKIKSINISNNNFEGELPDRFFSNDLFQALYFYNNDFSGCIENIDNLCLKPFEPELDTFIYEGQVFLVNEDWGFDLTGNPKLVWEGDLENACIGEDQLNAPCDDGDSNTFDDVINEDCECKGKPVSTNDINSVPTITISPNPLTQGDILNINLDMDNSIDVKIMIFDINGGIKVSKTVGNLSSNATTSLSTENLNSGLYFLQITSNSCVASRKIIVQ